MSLTKVTYVDGHTVIYAQNLNDIQDEIIAHGTSLGTKAPLDSPPLTGTPTAPTATESTDNTQIATTEFANRAALSAAANKQGKINASGLLKGDGNGGVSAAEAGTDYQAPLTAGTDYATPAGAKALGVTGAVVGEFARIASVDSNGSPTSWAKAPLCEIQTNPNLLDNWYFAGGGSQQGGGRFPINQRGQTSYTNGNSIDRWACDGSNTIALYPNYIAMSGSGTNFRQVLNAATCKLMIGRKVCVSILINNGSGLEVESESNVIQNLSEYQYIKSHGKILCVIFISDAFINVYFQATVPTVNVAAMKIELGDAQTLAHQENDVWVLNEIPDYQTEFAKCQRYFQVFRSQSMRPAYGEDFRPVMATANPTLGTMMIDNVTYYTASSEP